VQTVATCMGGGEGEWSCEEERGNGEDACPCDHELLVDVRQLSQLVFYLAMVRLKDLFLQ